MDSSYSIEWIRDDIGIIRYHPYGVFGSSYTWFTVLEKLTSNTCYLRGAIGVPPERKHKLEPFIKSLGITKVTWSRQNLKQFKYSLQRQIR